MFGRKDKKGDRKRGREKEKKSGGGGDLADMFGLNMGAVPDDAELEAELMAMEGVSPGKAGRKAGKSPMSVEHLNKMVAGIEHIGEEDDDLSDLSDIDEDELLGELEALEKDKPTPEPEPKPIPSPRRPLKSTPPSAPAPSQPASKGGGSVGVVSERLELYRQAVKEAEAAGESGKAKRYKRGLTTLEQQLRSARAGKNISEDDLPPIVAVKGTTPTSAPPSKERPTAPPPQPKPKPKPPPQSNLIDLNDPEFDEFNISEEELAAMAAAFVDDRKTSESPPPKYEDTVKTAPAPAPRPKPTPSPKAQAPPPPKPTPSQRAQAPPPPKPTPSQRAQAPPPPRPAPTKPDGMIDLDDPEFDEFTLTEDDIAAMAAAFVDDRKKPKLDDSLSQTTPTTSVTMDTSPAPRKPAPARPTPGITMSSPSKPTQSLPTRVEPPPSSGDEKETIKKLLIERREQYQSAAKAQSNSVKVREYRLVAARFAQVSKAFEQGQEIDLSQMPGPPPGYRSNFNIDVSKYTPKPTQPSKPAQGQSPSSSLASNAGQAEEDEVNPEIPIPKTTMEALEQRLAKYKEGVKSAQEKGESSRVRRLGRIVKSYEEAIKATKAGKPYDYDELPTPPGYPPIPAPKTMTRPKVVSAVPPTQSLPVAMATKLTAPIRRLAPSINDEQLRFIEQRRSELHAAARQEQTKGNKEQAVHYLKLRKGLDTMLEAAKSGIPVNLEEVPPSPFADLSQTKPSAAVLSHLKPAKETDGPTFDLIEKQLQKQIEICDTNAETYEKMGSTPASLQYQNMSQNCQRELLAIKGIRSQGLGPPKFTLETRKFTIVNSNPDVSSHVCEVEIIRGVNIPKPSGYEEKDLSVYVEMEFPWPNDDPPKQSTDTVKQSCNPEFEGEKFKFDIDRKKIKTMSRTFKRTPLKCGVWQKRTLRKDVFIGLGQLPLESLETKSEAREVVDLMDEKGRKQVGGKLEVVARLREPLTGTDKEEREEQWLVFQEAIAAKSSVSMPKPTAAKAPAKGQGASGGGSGVNFALLSPVKVDNMISLEALKLEFSLVQSAMKAGHRDKQTAVRGKQVQDRTDAIKKKLQTDTSFRVGYSRAVAREMQGEQQLEAQFAKQGKAKQAEVIILQKRRAAMEKELKALQSRKM